MSKPAKTSKSPKSPKVSDSSVVNEPRKANKSLTGDV